MRIAEIVGMGMGVGILFGILSIARFSLSSRSVDVASTSDDSRAVAVEAIAPRVIAIEPSYFDFGSKLQQEQIDCSFILTNRSSSAIRIRAIRAGCSCTMVSSNVVGTVIEPGGGLTVPIIYDTSSRAGRVNSTVELRIASQESGDFFLNYEVAGFVNSDFLYQPRSLNFGDIEPGAQPVTNRITFAPGALLGFGLISTQYSVGPFDVSARGLIAEISFSPPTENEVLSFNRSLTIPTNSERVPEASVNVSARLKPSLVAEPTVVVVTPSNLAQTSRIVVRSSEPSQVVGLRGRAGDFEEIHWEPSVFMGDGIVERGRSHELIVPNAELKKTEAIMISCSVMKSDGIVEEKSVSVRILNSDG